MTRHVLFVVVASRQGRSKRVPPGDGRIGVLKGDRGQPSCPRKNKGRPPTPAASCRRTFSRRPAITFRPKMWSVRQNLPGLGRRTRSSRHLRCRQRGGYPSFGSPRTRRSHASRAPRLIAIGWTPRRLQKDREQSSRLERVFSPPALGTQGGPYPGPGYPIASFCTHLIVQPPAARKERPGPVRKFCDSGTRELNPSCSLWSHQGRRRSYLTAANFPPERPGALLPATEGRVRGAS